MNTRAWFSSTKRSAAAGSKPAISGQWALIRQLGTAFLLVTLTLWLECGGIAWLITWTRRAVAGDLHKLGPFRSAALVVRVTTSVIALHGLQVLVWAGCYRWICLPSWESSLYFSATRSMTASRYSK
jgi:hypothetical protein